MATSEKPFALVVEDTEDIAGIIQMTLGRIGVESQHAPNGYSALETLVQRQPDLLMLDIGMPGMNGWEVLEAIKEQHPDADFPIIILTAFDDPTNKLIGKLQNRVFRYLTKPFDPELLEQTVREALKL